MARLIAALFVFAFAFAGVPAAHAQESPSEVEARNLFTAGQSAFQNGNYARAADYFEEAYALSHRSGLLYNLAFAADRHRDDARALEAYRAYLVAEPETSRRAEVESRISSLEQALAASQVQSEPEPGPSAEQRGESPATGGFHPAGIVTLVGAGVLFASFGVFAALSENEDQRLARECGRDAGAMCPAVSVETLQTFNTLADVSWIAGTALAVTGVVLLLALPAEQQRPTLALAPWFTHEGVGATMVGQW